LHKSYKTDCDLAAQTPAVRRNRRSLNGRLPYAKGSYTFWVKYRLGAPDDLGKALLSFFLGFIASPRCWATLIRSVPRGIEGFLPAGKKV
jgi:hypothetical protein